MKDDLAIARGAKLRRIVELAKERLGIDADDLEPYGHYKAKLSATLLERLASRKDGKLILVTAITPTPAGEGKTTTTIGLGDALNAIGKKAMVCVREPSLGPCFGVKGGGAGGGHSQVAPMEDINLHFTGDFHAVSIAHNLLAALVDNHIYFGNQLGFDIRRPVWRRVLDMNDRSLRSIVNGLGGTANGFPRETGYDIVAASEIMAILCLSSSLLDMRERFKRIIVGYTRENKPIRASELNAQGAMTVLMKDAIKPNLVQTLESTPTLVHGGPFANIAHGCNSVLATKTALKLADYVVTEAGFGADLGAEKFVDIKCRKSGLKPSAAVLVGTARALKYSGGAKIEDVNNEDTKALMQGMANMDRHVANIRENYGLPVIVALNRFASDTDRELDMIKKHLAEQGVEALVCTHFAQGSKGATELARAMVKLIDTKPGSVKFVYDDQDTLWKKIGKVAKHIYHASEVVADTAVRNKIEKFQEDGFGELPICIAKTQYSFSTDPKLRGAPSGHVFNVRDVYLSAGAGFMVVLSGDIMTMPGLPKKPASDNIDIDENGQIVGLA
ncbi:MAG TPA: formate--tetrahydrofolate ligase [Gammaproteobacteria bacterium]|jgi:formate--tetrahydrofolate ligase|nr:formate--tetrahydrofolate ligase [Gammaproteobacteria bacterium]